jgi:hypothetical protein
MILRKDKIQEIGRRSTKSYCLEISLERGLWNARNTTDRMNE